MSAFDNVRPLTDTNIAQGYRLSKVESSSSWWQSSDSFFVRNPQQQELSHESDLVRIVTNEQSEGFTFNLDVLEEARADIKDTVEDLFNNLATGDSDKLLGQVARCTIDTEDQRRELGLPEIDSILGFPSDELSALDSVVSLSSWNSFQGFHKQRLNRQTNHFLCHGSPRLWLIVRPRHADSLEALITTLVNVEPRCSQFVTHENVFVPPSKLRRWDITFETFIQESGDAVWLDYGVYSYYWDVGSNVVEETSFVERGWQTSPLYQDCQRDSSCGPAQIRLATPTGRIVAPDSESFQPQRSVATESIQDRSSALDVTSSLPIDSPKSVSSEFFISNAWKSSRRLPDGENHPISGQSHANEIREDVASSNPNSAGVEPLDETFSDLVDGAAMELSDVMDYSEGAAAEQSGQAATGTLGSRQTTNLQSLFITPPSSSEDRQPTATGTLLKDKTEPPKRVYTSPHHNGERIPAESTSQNLESNVSADSNSGIRNERHPISVTSSPAESGEPIPLKIPFGEENDLLESLTFGDHVYEKNHEEAIEKLISLGIKYQQDVVWPQGKPSDVERSLARFRPGLGEESWLDDDCINALLAYVTRDREDVSFVSSLTFARSMQLQEPSTVELPSEGMAIGLVPAFSHKHWFLISLDMMKNTITVHEDKSVGSRVAQFLLKAVTGSSSQPWQIFFDKYYYNNGNDCGVYLIAEAESVLHGRLTIRDPIALRRRYLGFWLQSLTKENRTVELLNNVRPKPLALTNIDEPSFLSVHEITDEHVPGELYLENLASAIGCADVITDLKSAIAISRTLPRMAVTRLDMAMQIFAVGDSNEVVGWLQKDLASLFVANRFSEIKSSLGSSKRRGFRGRGIDTDVYNKLEQEWRDPQRGAGLRKRLQTVNYRGQKLLKISKLCGLDRPLWMFFPGRKMPSPKDPSFMVTACMYRDISMNNLPALIKLVKDGRPEVWEALPRMYNDVVGCMSEHGAE